VRDAQVHKAYRAIVAKVNTTLAPFEAIKRFQVVPEEWSIETGELTPSMKLKRRIIVAKYAAEIGAFYLDEAGRTAARWCVPGIHRLWCLPSQPYLLVQHLLWNRWPQHEFCGGPTSTGESIHASWNIDRRRRLPD